MIKSESYVQLPKDRNALAEMYLEAIHYQIPELADRICSVSVIVNIIFQFFGNTNPFEAAQGVLANLRRFVVALGGTGTIMMGMQQDFEKLKQTILPQNKHD